MTETDDRYNRTKKVFLLALDLAEEKRVAYVEHTCGEDLELQAEVMTMLANSDRDDAYLSQPPELTDENLSSSDKASARCHAESAALDENAGRLIGTRVGQYAVRRVLGHGGMGVVYVAEQEHPRRRVALKVIRPGMVSGVTLRRFRHEASLLARLQSPGIAHIYEAGTAETPYGRQPFFAMEYIEGKSILEYAQDQKLSVRDRLRLVAEVAEAVHHAHQRGVIHRDIKPANIVVTAGGQPKVLDFGVARAAQDEPGDVSFATQTGQLLGTVPYMSPEQASGISEDVDIRSDVYALGVVAYELLTGRLPYDLPESRLQALRTIQEANPLPGSRIRRSLRGDIETVLQTALQKDKILRYQSASDLSADIHRFLRHEPISARPPRFLYRMRKLVRRHPAIFASFVAFAALIVVLALTGRLLVEVNTSGQLQIRVDAAERARHDALAKSNQKQAELAMQRGGWAAGIHLLQQGIDAGYADSFDLHLGIVECLYYMAKYEDARKKLKLLDEALMTESQTGRFLLWKAELAKFGPDDVSIKSRLVKRALHYQMDFADYSYAQSLLAASNQEAIDLLLAVLDHNPLHHRARSRLILLYVFALRFDEADGQIRIARELYANDPAILVRNALFAALNGDRLAYSSAIEGLHSQHGDAKVAQLKTLLDFLLTFFDQAKADLSAYRKISLQPLMWQVLRNGGLKAGAFPTLKNCLNTFLGRFDSSVTGPWLHLLQGLGSSGEAALEDLRQAALEIREGTIALVYSVALYENGRGAEAADVLWNSREFPLYILPARRHREFDLRMEITKQFREGMFYPGRVSTKDRARLLTLTKELAFEPLDPILAREAATVAKEFGELDLSAHILNRCLVSHGDNVDLLRSLSDTEFARKAYVSALGAAERALVLKPDLEDMKKRRATIRKELAKLASGSSPD